MENTFDEDDHHLLLLPQDVLIQILVLLPVISLLRFKSVCKSWCTLIQSSFFIDLHLNTLPPPPHKKKKKKFGTFIFQTLCLTSYIRRDLIKMQSDAFMLSSVSGPSGSDDEDEDDEFKWEDLGFPPCYEVDEDSSGISIIMVGSCNGLICLHDTKPRDVFLWNPATRQFRLLPKSLSIAGIGDLEREFVGFGYDDVKTKDYKVLQISWFKPYGICGDGDDDNSIGSNWIPVEEYIFRVQVYNLSTDCWRFLEGINSLPGHPHQGLGMNHGVYLNGSYYFLAGYAGCEFILSFDFTKEIFTTLQIQVPPDYHVDSVLTYLGEKLAVLVTAYGFGSYSILVLNEHGGSSSSSSSSVKESSSWTKIHSIQLDNFCTLGLPPGRPRGISNDGEFAFIITGAPFNSLQLFNLVTNEVKKGFRTDNAVIKADVYKQSLASIYGNGSIR